MLGYIRPWTDDLLMKDYKRYRAVYCGVCKRLGALHGQFSRLALSYDACFLAIFFLAFVEDEPEMKEEACLSHPMTRHLTAQAHPILDFAAGLTCYLGRAKFQDDKRDGEVLSSLVPSLVLRTGGKKFESEYPELVPLVEAKLQASWEYEQEQQAKLRPNSLGQAEQVARAMAGLSGQLLALIFAQAAQLSNPQVFGQAKNLHIASLLGQELGAWVYLIDALDDKEEDETKDRFNPYRGLKSEDYLPLALGLLAEAQGKADSLAALFPYYKDAAIIENIVHLSLQRQVDRVLAKKDKA